MSRHEMFFSGIAAIAERRILRIMRIIGMVFLMPAQGAAQERAHGIQLFMFSAKPLPFS